MLPVSYYAPTEVTSPKVGLAFARGCGGTVSDDPEELFPGPVALFGSPSRWPILRQAQAEGRDWYYIDHGYFGRKTYYRITKNAYQHDGLGSACPDRFKKFGRQVQPWRKTGSHILICPNSAIYFGLHGLDVDAWLANVTQQIRQHTDREIRVRWKTQQWTRPIDEDLADCWAVVVFSSAAALDALIVGVPVFVLAPFAAGSRMGLSDLSRIEQPIYPEGREPFLWNLADQQWTVTEIYKGMAWNVLQPRACAA